jgi:hypothetical protein
VLADRGQYIAAAFCVVRAYLAAGRPNLAPKLASFEGWSDTVRSALIWLGRADPCATMVSVVADDPEQMTLVAVLTAWSRAIGTGYSRRLTIAELLAMVGEQDAVRNYKHPELRAGPPGNRAPRLARRQRPWFLAAALQGPDRRKPVPAEPARRARGGLVAGYTAISDGARPRRGVLVMVRYARYARCFLPRSTRFGTSLFFSVYTYVTQPNRPRGVGIYLEYHLYLRSDFP